MHRRHHPRNHYFRYRAFWLLIDVDELPRLTAGLRLFSHNRSAVFSLLDTDHGDGSMTPLRSQVERCLSEAGLDICGGRIDLLCMPSLGCCFNPLSVYFCHRVDGTLAATIYQVHNTFGERHRYILAARRCDGAIHQRCDKSFYVSPFFATDLSYEFRVAGPNEHVAVAIRAGTQQGTIFRAALVGSRRELSDRTLMRLLLMMPLLSWKVIAAIHWQALRLWLKGVRYHRRDRGPMRATGPLSPGIEP
jgi:DUF1365 family protein